LQWSVGRVLSGETDPVKEYQLGQEVFGKPESWDPRIDSSVRVEFNRMRQKLREYYEGEGASDPVIIEFPYRGYLPAFTSRMASLPPERPAAEPIASDPSPAVQKPRRISRLMLAFALALLVLGVVAFGTFRRFAVAPPITTVAVLPFMDLTPGGQRGYISDGFSEELTNSLAMSKGLRVVARTSAFQFKGKNVDVREIGRRLGAGAVVEGSILGQGNRIRVIVQLNRTADGTHLWQAQYDRDAKDLLGIEDEVAQAVAGALRARLTGPTPAEYDPGPEAFNEYLMGFGEEQKATPASLRLAEMHYQNALRLAPRYAWVHARLASVHLMLSGSTGPQQKAELENVRREAEAAVSLEPRLPMPNAQLAIVNYVLNWNWPAAEADLRRALALGPSATAHQTYAWALTTRGRFAEAENQLHQAFQLDPLNPVAYINVAALYRMSGRPAAARQEVQAVVAQTPDWFRGRLTLGYLEIFDNRPADGLADLQRAAALAPGTSLTDAGVAIAYSESGRRSEALALLRQMESQADTKGYVRYQLALVSAYLGDRDRLFHWLGQSADFREQQVLNMRVDPSLAPYQQDARMIALERRTGLIQ
jgi:TolB-like protein/Flp pilus assembly protein TadD